MLPAKNLAQAIVSAEASDAVKTVKESLKTFDEKAVAHEIEQEVCRIMGATAITLAHIEGHYESQVANLKLKVISHSGYAVAVYGTIVFIAGSAFGHFFK